MPPTHLTSTSRALYRIFIAPTLGLRSQQTPNATVPLLFTPAFAPHTRTSPPGPISMRTLTYKKDTSRHAITDHYTIDRAIPGPYINLVDEEGTYHPSVPLSDALAQINRTTQYLVQMSESKVDEFGNLDPNDVPVVKVVSKIALREQHQRKLELARRQAKGLGAGPAPKNLELNWAIAPGDLKHRLGRLKEFLDEGRKVEIMLGPKKKGRAATEDEVRGVMISIEEVVQEVKGSREVKRQGNVGGVLMVTLEGKKTQEKKGENKGEPRKRKEDRKKEEAEKGGGQKAEASL
ncbi:hypothetical protein IQ06DRAFT_276805 [Phaeosphaeriaceae sp. SRC1lsM3a]|nr:hypothetical protein IQ06DRAFT_276805 [Stagonospora sp. SRC1lsM3a]